MSATVDRLIALAGAQIAQDTRVLLDGGNVAAWQRAMERAIVTQATAAAITAVGERGWTGRIREFASRLLGSYALSRADRQAIRAYVTSQRAYLARFAADIPRLSVAQIAARAAQYATSVRSFYYAQRWGDWDIPDRLLPGMQTCMGNCKCSISVTDSGDGTGVLLRTMGGTEHHCTACPPLAGEHPVKRRRARNA